MQSINTQMISIRKQRPLIKRRMHTNQQTHNYLASSDPHRRVEGDRGTWKRTWKLSDGYRWEEGDHGKLKWMNMGIELRWVTGH